MLYRPNELKIGHKVIFHKTPCVIIENECIKPGKGQAFSRIRFKQIISGKILERTLKSGEFVQSAYVKEIRLIYLYRDGELRVFMNKHSFDQINIHDEIIGDSIKWLKEQYDYLVVFWDDNPILVVPPVYIQLRIIKTVSIGKNVASSGLKLATLSTGSIIKVPFFIQSGELIKVNTYLNTYISRVRDNSV